MLETIVALATPPMKSALAIIRLSGEDTFGIVSNFFSGKIKLDSKNKILHGYILDGEEKVDEVVLLAYKGPYSFTGEDSVEIISHGSPLIAKRIVELAIKFGARQATGGEFSSRSFLNNKMDLIQAEAINDLINAESDESRKISMLSLSGETSKLILPIKKSLGDLLSNIEVNINYPEYEDIEQVNEEQIKVVCNQNIELIDELIENGQKGKIIKDGVKIAIVGKPNVGKSSLLNAFLGEEKAIVTDIKGTTRDVVEGTFNLNGIILRFFDTAGIRESSDKIEQIGIKKSGDSIEKADLVLFVLDDPKMDKEDEEILNMIKHKKYIKVYNKQDFVSYKKEEGGVYISAKTEDIDSLKIKIMTVLGIEEDNFNKPSIANEREQGLLMNVKLKLNEALNELNNGAPIDLINVKIQDAYLTTLSIIGEDHDFDIAKEIFSRFCVGK